jgi:hypothetical protein
MDATSTVLLLVIAWLLHAGLGYYVGEQTGRGGGEGFVLGLLFGPIGAIVAALLPRDAGAATRAGTAASQSADVTRTTGRRSHGVGDEESRRSDEADSRTIGLPWQSRGDEASRERKTAEDPGPDDATNWPVGGKPS